MKNYKLYTYTSLIFVVLFGILSMLTIPLIVKQYTILFLDNTYTQIGKEANTLQIAYKELAKKDNFSSIAQQIIQDTQNDIAFLSIIDWTGNYVSYPDITQIGETADDNKNANFEGEINGQELYNRFFNYFNSLKDNIAVGIVTLKPLKDSDLILVYNLNLKEVSSIINQMRGRTYIIFVILGLFLLLVLLTIIRLVSANSNKLLEEKVLSLEYNAQSLAKLNESISSYQERLEQQSEETQTVNKEEIDQEPEETSKQRILTYVRNELVSILITDIAYVYVESTITYIIRKDGKMATSNDSLDKIYSVLDKELFFKTNRQFIVAITAIEKITKFENNKLKIQVKPKSEVDIIIGKNKASAFKQWLDL